MLQIQEILSEAFRERIGGDAYALATVVRAELSTAAKPGAKALILADGSIEGWIGGGCAQPAVLKTALQCLQDGQARLIRVSPNSGQDPTEGIIDFAMSCQSGGTLDIFIEPITSAPKLWVYGESPAAKSLVELASRTGFVVTILKHGADPQNFPDARTVIDDFDSEGQPDFAVVATQGNGDQQALIAAVESNAPFVAFIASKRKGGKLQQALKDKGLDAKKVDAIQVPAGLEIGAETPEEMALSVLAALVAERRQCSTHSHNSDEVGKRNVEAEHSCCPESTPIKEVQTKTRDAISCCGNDD